jgi:hypothetical protein
MMCAVSLDQAEESQRSRQSHSPASTLSIQCAFWLAGLRIAITDIRLGG